MNRRILPVLLLAAIVPSALQAQDTPWNRATLENLDGVFIRIEAAEACSTVGVAATDYEAQTSLKLIDSNVGVLTEAEMLRDPALPELRVTLGCAEGDGAVAYSLELRVQQAAKMLRDEQVTLPEAVTWYAMEIGATASSDVKAAMDSALEGKLTEFTEAWVAVNGEEGS